MATSAVPLCRAKDTGEVFSGTAAQAKNALWSFLGSTPEAIADAFVDTVDAMGKKLHAGLAEPIVGFHDPVAALDCSTVTVYVDGGKYLAIDTSGVAPSRLVFETDAQGRATEWRVGLSPQVDYVEGCS